MRGLIRLEPRANFEGVSDYHYKLKGRLGNSLEGTVYDDGNDEYNGISLCFSNIFNKTEGNNFNEGGHANVIVSSPYEDVIDYIKEDVEQNPEFNIGDMSFVVKGFDKVNVGVGHPGTSDTLRTHSGVLVPIPKEEWDDWNLDVKYNADEISWSPDHHPRQIFKSKINQNLEWKHSVIYDDYLIGPEESEQFIFDKMELLDVYPKDIQVSTDYTGTFILTKWDFHYTVRNDEHRRWLNMILNTGIGFKNAYGLGFVNIPKDNQGDKQ